MAKFINPSGLYQPKTKNMGYSMVCKVGEIVYVSGQTSLDAEGNLVGRDDPEAQVRQVWRNIEIALEAIGGSLRDIVSTTTYLTSNKHRAVMNKVRSELFPSNPPTSTGIVVSELYLPEQVIEIEAIAHLDA